MKHIKPHWQIKQISERKSIEQHIIIQINVILTLIMLIY